MNNYRVYFDGKAIETTVTNKAEVVDRWVREIQSMHGARETIVGLDLEWKPSNVVGIINKIATLQLCIDKVADDVSKLRDDYGLVCSRSKDIRDHAMTLRPLKWYRRPGLKALALDVAGLNMKKLLHVCRSNWC
ncbi:hypothetical protein Dimus_015674 [Dionaea muscipula]